MTKPRFLFALTFGSSALHWELNALPFAYIEGYGRELKSKYQPDTEQSIRRRSWDVGGL